MKMTIHMKLGVAILLVSTALAFTYTIEDDQVYINDSNAYMMVTPHTIYDSGYINSSLQVKTPGVNQIDIVYGFDTTLVKPSKPYIYKPGQGEENASESIQLFGVSSIKTTGQSCDIGNEYNSIKRSVAHTVEINNVSTEITEVFCFEDYTQDGDNYTLDWYTTIITDWVKIKKRFNKINYDYKNMTTWYYLKNITINTNQLYTLRSYINLNAKFDEKLEGKYWFAAKPTDESLSEAIQSGHLYYLDPWFQGANAPYSYYTLDDADWNGANNEDPRANGLSVENVGVAATGVTGVNNEAVKFVQEASADRLETTNVSFIDNSADSFTISFWFNLSDYSDPYIFMEISNDADRDNVRLFFKQNTLSYLACRRSDDNGANTKFADLDTGKWYHGIIMYNNSADACYLYINNTLTATVAGRTDINPSTIWRIGNHDGEYEEIGGYIDEIATWERAITGAERTQLYNSGAGYFYPFPSSCTITENTTIEDDLDCSDSGFSVSNNAVVTIVNSQILAKNITLEKGSRIVSDVAQWFIIG